MSNKLYNDTYIQDIADAIREKNNSSATYKVAEMASAINDLELEAHVAKIVVTTSETTLYNQTITLTRDGSEVSSGTMSSTGGCSFGGITTAGKYTVTCGNVSKSVTISSDAIMAKEEFNIVLSLVEMLDKGDLIYMELGNTAEAGNNNYYRVLSTNGNTAFVMAMYDYNTSCAFSSSNNTYAGGTLDTMLNTTFFESLSTGAQNAIQSVDITQYQYTWDSSSYNTSTHASYFTYSSKSTKATISQRKVFALDYEDIVNYFGGDSFSTSNIWYMFWNTPSQPSTVTYPWLRSAYVDDYSNNSNNALYVRGYSGDVDFGNYYINLAARPAFYIDLSKIEFTNMSDLPAKGARITMNLGNDTPAAGTNNEYRVLKLEGNKALVMAMYDMKTNQVFNSSSNTTTTIGSLTCQKYEDSTLDNYLEGTFYNSLSDTAKAAIEEATITQDAWYFSTDGSPSYTYTNNNSGSTGSGNISKYSSTITIDNRHVFALSEQDIIDYLGTASGGTITYTQIWTMFWNTPSQPSTVTYPWLRSAFAGDSFYALFVYGSGGSVSFSNCINAYAARPAFYIDLSKIEWTLQS